MPEFLKPLYTADEMRAAEAGHDAEALKERAGAAVARAVRTHFPAARRVAVVCGTGSNGDDGRIAVRVLREGGLDAVETHAVEQADLIVDALLGTGFRGEPRPETAALIERINAAPAPVLSVDLPSGVDASTGEVPGVAVDAELTVTFHGPKLGLLIAPGMFRAGSVLSAEIGLDHAETQHKLVDDGVLELVPRKRPEDSKYSAGAVLVVGGAPGLTGAVCLAAEAALRADAGYVAVAVPSASLSVVETKLLEPVTLTWEQLDDAIPKAGAVAIGPGLGRTQAATDLRDRLLAELEQPVVLDADGLHALEPGSWRPPVVLTPHAGELGRLLDRSSDWVGEHRLEAARDAAVRFGCVCLLKGADSIVSAPDGSVLVRHVDAPSLATLGTGDVLTGIVAAFLAKGLEPRLAAAAGATAHALAARSLPPRGLIASDVIAALPGVLP